MNKKELIRTISQDANRMASQEKVALALDKSVEIMKRTLESGASVKWAGFGSLIVRDIPLQWFYFPQLKECIISKQ